MIPPNVQWPGWETVNLIGRGSFGCVYEIRKKDVFEKTFSAALKVISVPESSEAYKMLLKKGMSEEHASQYCKKTAEKIAAEYRILDSLKGTGHIVAYDDYLIVPHEEDPGYDILIKMELLTPLLEYHLSHPLQENDVIRLGTDICMALEACEKQNPPIIHRDLKPENLFVGKNGDFKLGDFGVARALLHDVSDMTRIGNLSFMAPEVFQMRPYGASVDLYSLGLVLYYYLNGQRLPLQPQNYDAIDTSEAIQSRLMGETLPEPAGGSPELRRIVMKAIAWHPEDRYHSAREFREALENIVPPPQPKRKYIAVILIASAFLMAFGIGAAKWPVIKNFLDGLSGHIIHIIQKENSQTDIVSEVPDDLETVWVKGIMKVLREMHPYTHTGSIDYGENHSLEEIADKLEEEGFEITLEKEILSAWSMEPPMEITVEHPIDRTTYELSFEVLSGKYDWKKPLVPMPEGLQFGMQQSEVLEYLGMTEDYLQALGQEGREWEPATDVVYTASYAKAVDSEEEKIGKVTSKIVMEYKDENYKKLQLGFDQDGALTKIVYQKEW